MYDCFVGVLNHCLVSLQCVYMHVHVNFGAFHGTHLAFVRILQVLHVHVQYTSKKTFQTVPFKRRLNGRAGPCFLR